MRSSAGPSWSRVLSGKGCGVCWTVWKDLASRVPFTMCWVGPRDPLPPSWPPPKVSMGHVPPHTMAADYCICFRHRGLPSSPAPHAGGPRKPSPGPREPLGKHGLLAHWSPGAPSKRRRQVTANASAFSCPSVREQAELSKSPGLPLCLVFSRVSSLPRGDKTRPLGRPDSYFSCCKWASQPDRLFGSKPVGVHPMVGSVLGSLSSGVWHSLRNSGCRCLLLHKLLTSGGSRKKENEIEL